MDYNKDYYGTLGVDRNATADEIKAAYRRLAKLHHPDRNPGDSSAEERFKEINEANDVLGHDITRHIYDSYHAGRRHHTSTDTGKAATPEQPAAAKNTRTYTVQRDKKIHITGSIEVKFYGEPSLSNAAFRQWEQHFVIFPTEVLLTVESSAIYKTDPPEAYRMGYAAADLFATPLQQPIQCKINSGEQEEYYHLYLHDLRIQAPVLTGITRHDGNSYGTLLGTCYGYVLHQYEETITEDYEIDTRPTGKVDTKFEAGNTYVREEYADPAGQPYWSNWKPYTGYTPRATTTRYYWQYQLHCGTLFWLVLILLTGLIWKPFFIIALSVLFLYLLTTPVGRVLLGILRLVPVLFLALVMMGAILSNSRQTAPDTRHLRSAFDRVDSQNKIIQYEDQSIDTLITHHIQWEDPDSNLHRMTLSLPVRILRKAQTSHRQMDKQAYAYCGIAAVYQSMIISDAPYLRQVALSFDSAARKKSLNRRQQAAMVVSCIQSIPYTLILEGNCPGNNTDGFVKQYLSACAGDCCKGYSPFGVQSPVEFVGDLKGDCDTRSLFLYTLLGNLGYRVALMTSEYYRHALIAVALDEAPQHGAAVVYIKQRPYYLWETTAKGFAPGKLPAAVSNLSHWHISLLQ